MTPQKPVPFLLDIAANAVQNFVLDCLRTKTREHRTGLPSTFNKKLAALRETVFEIIPPKLHQNVHECLNLDNVPSPPTAYVTGTIECETALSYADSLAFVARLCQDGAVFQKILTTNMWLPKILDGDRKLMHLTDITLVPPSWDVLFHKEPSKADFDDCYVCLEIVANGCPMLRTLKGVACSQFEKYSSSHAAADFRGHLRSHLTLEKLSKRCANLKEIYLSTKPRQHVTRRTKDRNCAGEDQDVWEVADPVCQVSAYQKHHCPPRLHRIV